MTRNLSQSWPQYDTARTLDSAPQLALGPLSALAECAHGQGHDNERTDGHVLEVRIHLEHVQRVGDDPGEEHAEERADNLAAPAVIGVPPMTAAPMACSSIPLPVEGWAAPMRDRSRVAAIPTSRPLMMKKISLFRLTGMPAR